ncbi:MAG TPA: amidohydrolase family protein [Blastocatellia bacterium]|nr:amidohydrolase family protein [Blastocatellia bacterium]
MRNLRKGKTFTNCLYIFSVTALLLVPAIANGQGQGAKVITGATLIDGTSRDPIKDAVVLIEGGRISRAGPRGEIQIPEGAQVIDARGKFIIPGLADMHNHLGEGTFVLGQDRPDYRRTLRHMLGWGFTLIFSPGLPDLKTFADLKSAAASDAGAYPRFFAVGRQFGAKGGHGSFQGGYTPETPEEARAAVRELKAADVDAVKLVYTDLTYVSKKPWPMLKSDVMAAIIDEAHKQGLKAYVHAPILKYAKEVLRAGADGLVHGILSDPVDDELIELMKKNRAAYITTHAIFESVADISGWARRVAAFNDRKLIAKEVIDVGLDPKTEAQWEARWDNLSYMKERLPVLRSNARKVWDAGILVVAGSDTGDSGAGTLLGIASQIELVLLVESGLRPKEVLQAATINAARMIGREKDLGSIEPGKLADLLILDADPLADIGNVRRVYRVVKGGVVYDPAELLRAGN